MDIGSSPGHSSHVVGETNGFEARFKFFSEEERRKQALRQERFGFSSPIGGAFDEKRSGIESEVSNEASIASTIANRRRVVKLTDKYETIPRRMFAERFVDPTPDVSLRENAVYVYGVDLYTTSQLLSIFGQFGPLSVEWVNDSSAVILFEDSVAAKRVLESNVQLRCPASRTSFVPSSDSSSNSIPLSSSPNLQSSAPTPSPSQGGTPRTSSPRLSHNFSETLANDQEEDDMNDKITASSLDSRFNGYIENEGDKDLRDDDNVDENGQCADDLPTGAAVPLSQVLEHSKSERLIKEASSTDNVEITEDTLQLALEDVVRVNNESSLVTPSGTPASANSSSHANDFALDNSDENRASGLSTPDNDDSMSIRSSRTKSRGERTGRKYHADWRKTAQTSYEGVQLCFYLRMATINDTKENFRISEEFVSRIREGRFPIPPNRDHRQMKDSRGKNRKRSAKRKRGNETRYVDGGGDRDDVQKTHREHRMGEDSSSNRSSRNSSLSDVNVEAMDINASNSENGMAVDDEELEKRKKRILRFGAEGASNMEIVNV